MNAYRNASYAGFVLYLIAVVLLAHGLVNLGTERKLDAAGMKATGEVIELAVTEPYRQAIVRFSAQDGRTVTFLDKLFWNWAFETYEVGDEVEVIYDPADPEGTATIDQFFQRNTAPWWPVIVAAAVFAAGFLMRRIMLRKAKILDGQMAGTIAVDPDAGRKSLNKVMLVAAAAIGIIILILVVAFGSAGG